MKFIVSSSKLLKQLQLIGGIIQSNNTLPILDNFLFELKQGELVVSASDLETTMSVNLEVETEDVGSAAVPAKVLMDTLKTFRSSLDLHVRRRVAHDRIVLRLR